MKGEDLGSGVTDEDGRDSWRASPPNSLKINVDEIIFEK